MLLATNEKYDYRYSVLPIVFARLIEEHWLEEAGLHGLEEDKLKAIKGIAVPTILNRTKTKLLN